MIFTDLGKITYKKNCKSISLPLVGMPLPRSERNIRALEALRGATCGCDYTESFMLIKERK
jgi:N-acetylglucosamine malate deacetylase 1